ncbi:MAG: hypothetical protein FGM23_04185, partial [Alphaproteobacteria bacterium]|nr:hypothetical protein [Alphaproteobacteria bacterium]
LHNAEHLRRLITNTNQSLTDCDAVFITLGHTETWFDNELGIFLNGTPPPQLIARSKDRFCFTNVGFLDAFAAISRLLELIRAASLRPKKFILTVSPVPIQTTFTAADIIQANTHAKSTLRAVAGELSRSHRDVDYFPSYEIVLNSDDTASRERVMESAKGLMQALAAGADFYKLAKQFSSSPSAAEGGNLGLIPESLLAEDQRQLFKNQSGGRVVTLERNDEIIIYWLQEVRPPNQAYSKSIQLNVKQILLPAEMELSQVQATQQSLASTANTANTDCDQLAAQVASQVSGGRVIDLGNAKLGDFSQSLAAELASMPVGGVTTPIQADSGYTMLKLCQRNLEGVAGLSTKELTDGLRQEKLIQAAAQYFRTLKRSARIEIKANTY